MSKLRDFCVECRGNFGILERSEAAPNTCVYCAANMRPSSFGECERCQRLIQRGDRIHLAWVKLCQKCAKQAARDNDMPVPCDTVAR